MFATARATASNCMGATLPDRVSGNRRTLTATHSAWLAGASDVEQSHDVVGGIPAIADACVVRRRSRRRPKRETLNRTQRGAREPSRSSGAKPWLPRIVGPHRLGVVARSGEVGLESNRRRRRLSERVPRFPVLACEGAWRAPVTRLCASLPLRQSIPWTPPRPLMV